MSSPSAQYSEVQAVVQRYIAGRHGYLTSAYKEAQARSDFIDPLFRLLGWDVDNLDGLQPEFRQVRREDTLYSGAESLKAPDYGFYLGGSRLFFLEAKKPSVDITKNANACVQLRSYGWSAKLPFSVLANVEHLAVYDCRIRPKSTDSAATARVLLVSIDELPQRWPEVTALLSRAEVLSGRSRLALRDAASRGEKPVDNAFLDDMESWRELLAKQIIRHCEGLTAAELNTAVQLTLDRIIFLRICEDRGIEPRGRLQTLVEGDDIYRRLLRLFRDADDRYNSGLFHFRAEADRATPRDSFTPTLNIPDEALCEVVSALYWPRSQYRFEMISADILGSVYERFLGREIVLSGTGKTARVEEKPYARESKGVYYTPQYVVLQLLGETLGKALAKCETPKDASAITICDPACGSGSFLLAAYQMLLDWHTSYYSRNPGQPIRDKGKRAIASPIRKASDGSVRLVPAVRKQILLDCIYGVDLDPQAVEVTKLSLLLKVLEGESPDAFIHNQRALPDLGSNIQCGNSLVSHDAAGVLLDNGEATEIEKLRLLDWRKSFPDVFKKSGGWSVVVGNPPYLNLKRGFSTDQEKRYFDRCYKTAAGQYDCFALFSERALQLLAKGGWHAFVIPKPALASESYEQLRQVFLANTVESVFDLGEPFEDASVEAVSVVCRKSSPDANHVTVMKRLSKDLVTGTPKPDDLGRVTQASFHTLPHSGMPYLVDQQTVEIVRKLFSMPDRLGDLLDISRGVEAGKSTEGIHLDKKPSKRFKPLLRGEDVAAFVCSYYGATVDTDAFLPKDLKASHLYEDGPKVLVRRVTKQLVAAIDRDGRWALNTLYIVRPKGDISTEVIAAILNSSLVASLHRLIYLGDDKLFPYIRQSQITALPAPPLARLTERSTERLVKVVENIEDVAPSGKSPTVLAGLIDEMNREVASMYGLGEEEAAALKHRAFHL